MRKNAPVGVGVVGLGFMGFTHFQAGLKLRGGRVVAIVTSDPRKAKGDFRGVRGNFGSGGGKIDLDGITVHSSLESMLKDASVELVDLCLPSHLHRAAALQCLAAGKNVLVEKPIALTPADAKRMLDGARKAKRLLLVGQVLKFFPEFSLLEDALGDRRWGDLIALHLRRRIAKPDWGAGSWFADSKKSGGMVVDLHIHDTDFITHLFGRPRAVSSQGLLRQGRVDFIRTTYHFEKSRGRGAASPLITSEAGWVNAPGLAFTHGYDAYFEEATIHFDSFRSPQPTIYEKKGPRVLKLKAVDGFIQELEAAAVAVRSGRVPPRLSAESAARSLEICHAEETSARTGRMVTL